MKPLLLIAVLALLPAAASAQDSATANPFAGNPAAISEGRSLYNSTCTGCHGANGGAGEIGPGLAVPGRSYGRTTDAEIFDAIRNGIPATVMPPHKGVLTDEQTWKITAYVKGLRGTAIDAPMAGDVSHGAAVFWGKGQCGTCHMLNGRGSVIGPDLSDIAGTRKTSSIIDALTKAQHRVYGAGGDQPHTLPLEVTYPVVDVVTRDGKTIRGVLRNQDSFSMQVMGLDQKLYLLDRAAVKSVTHEQKSLMPTDYDRRLSPAEFADLLAFLTRQGHAPTPAGAPVAMPGKDKDPS